MAAARMGRILICCGTGCTIAQVVEEVGPIHGGDAIDGAVAGMSHETSGV